MKETKHVGTFTAHDAERNEYTVFVFQDIILCRSSDGTSRTPGRLTLETDDGTHVNWIEKGKYRIIGVEIDIFSDDPNAP